MGSDGIRSDLDNTGRRAPSEGFVSMSLIEVRDTFHLCIVRLYTLRCERATPHEHVGRGCSILPFTPTA